MKLKNSYEVPNIEFLKFLVSDIISTSEGGDPFFGDGDDFGGGNSGSGDIEIPPLPVNH